ncbi:MAG: YciI family protein [Kiloniellaceae bacterium]
MFIVLLKFAANRDQAGRHMEGHKAWLQSGFDDSVFILAGSLQPQRGGAILAENTSLEELQGRVDDDPFVVEKVVTAEILEITPSRADDRLRFLLGTAAAA